VQQPTTATGHGRSRPRGVPHGRAAAATYVHRTSNPSIPSKRIRTLLFSVAAGPQAPAAFPRSGSPRLASTRQALALPLRVLAAGRPQCCGAMPRVSFRWDGGQGNAAGACGPAWGAIAAGVHDPYTHPPQATGRAFRLTAGGGVTPREPPAVSATRIRYREFVPRSTGAPGLDSRAPRRNWSHPTSRLARLAARGSTPWTPRTGKKAVATAKTRKEAGLRPAAAYWM